MLVYRVISDKSTSIYAGKWYQIQFWFCELWVPQGSVLWALLFLLYINYINHAIGCDNVKLFADDTFLFTNNRNIDIAKKKRVINLKKIPVGMLPTNYRLTAERQILCSFMQRISRFRKNFNCIHITFLIINRVKCLKHFGLMIDGCLGIKWVAATLPGDGEVQHEHQ